MKSGTLKWYDTKNGFGFIVPDDGGDDVLVCRNHLLDDERALFSGDRMHFLERYCVRGRRAVRAWFVEGGR